MHQMAAPKFDVPLIVDLDHTLVKGDAISEAYIQLMLQKPARALRELFLLSKGQSASKANFADGMIPNVSALIFDETVLDMVRQAREKQRKVFLATAADKRFGEAIAKSTGLFDGVFCSDKKGDFNGQTKADRLVAAFGHHGFDYLGNARADLPVMHAARTPFILNSKTLAMRTKGILLAPSKSKLLPYISALRPHQYLKNALLGLAPLAAHAFSLDVLITVSIAITSFSLGASSIYLINDVFDLPYDRVHPEKRKRALAAGIMPIRHAAILSFFLSALSLSIAALLPISFAIALVSYFGLALTYSFYFKRKLMIDVVVLAALYGIRVIAGGFAVGVTLSHWLLGFCFFIFLCLALMKRATEIMLLKRKNFDNADGRNYRWVDLQNINALIGASGFVAVLIFALYLNSPQVIKLYSRPELLWGICILLVYWLGRTFLLVGRGEMRYDPVIFAATDRNSWLVAVLAAAVFFLAI